MSPPETAEMQILAVFGSDPWTSNTCTSEGEGEGGEADHFVNQLLSLISLEKLLKSCQPELCSVGADNIWYFW